MRRATPGLLALALLLGASGGPPPLPPAQPLNATPAALAQIPYLERGPHAVALRLLDRYPVAGRTMRLRIARPAGDGPFPLVLFSHGFASDVDEYDAVLGHWASHGFVVIAPFHADGGGTPRAIVMSLVKGKAGLIRGRVEDIAHLLDHLDALAPLAPVDPARIVVAGHSFGAFTAQQFGGATVTDPDDGTPIGGRDPRVRAVLALSPPGEMFGLINAQSWRAMDAPMLATTGTWDIDGHFVTDWRQHRLSFESSPPGDKHLLVIEGADHYLGNLICRTHRDAPPQHDALRMVNATTAGFLAAAFGDGPFPPAPLDRLSGGYARLSAR